MKKILSILFVLCCFNGISQSVPTPEMIDSSKSRLRQMVFGAGALPKGAVTQITNKSTAVTINKMAGRITMAGNALAAGAEAWFTVNNNVVNEKDIIIPNIQSGTPGAYLITIGTILNGSFTITISNVSTGSLSEAIAINFLVINGG